MTELPRFALDWLAENVGITDPPRFIEDFPLDLRLLLMLESNHRSGYGDADASWYWDEDVFKPIEMTLTAAQLDGVIYWHLATRATSEEARDELLAVVKKRLARAATP